MSSTTTASPLDQVVELLGRVPLFKGLPRSDLERIAGLMRVRAAEPGELIFREGDEGDRFYIVYSGAVEILKERPRGDHERLAVKRAGEAFGEMSLLTDAPRSASVKTTEPTQLLVVSRADFEKLLGGETLTVRLMRGLARALRALDVRFAAREAASNQAQVQIGQVLQRSAARRVLPQADGYELAAALVAESAGGSLWDAQPYAGGVLISVLDVKGRDLPAAYLLGLTRALLREIVRTEDALERVLPRLNEALADQIVEGADACVEAGLIAVADGGLRCSIAGEQPGLVIRAGGGVDEIGSNGPPLGILPHFDYGASEFALGGGDIAMVFSEAEAGLVRGAADLVRSRRGESVERIAATLQAAMQKAGASRPGGLDLAFTVVKRLDG